jgi:hypothetical protein
MKMFESAPCSLVLPIAPLDDFVLAREYFFLEDLRASALVDTGDFENLSGVDV